MDEKTQKLINDAQYKIAYWQAYAQAIRDADLALQQIGDDRTVRNCRKAVLSLAGVEYHTEWVITKPAWPKTLHDVELTIL